MTEVEQSLVDHVVRGEPLDLASYDSRSIRAAVLRDMVLGRLAADPDPHGLRLRGAHVVGRLDLDNVTSTVVVELRDCVLDEGLTACGADLPSLDLNGSRLSHPTEPPFHADRLTAGRVELEHTVVTAESDKGAIRLHGAELGELRCVGTKLSNPSGPALSADRLVTARSVLLRDGFEAVSRSRWGAVRLFGVRISGQLDCSDATIRNESGPALHLDGSQLESDVLLQQLTAVGASGRGAVRLLGARIGGAFACDGAVLRNESGPALEAERLQVDGDVLLRDEFVATGVSETGALCLAGGWIGGQLDCSTAVLRNESGPALDAERLQVDSWVFLRDGFVATGVGELGAVRLLSARVGGLDSEKAVIRNESGPALIGVSLQAAADVILQPGFVATGAGASGAVCLVDARVGGELRCSGAVLRNESGPALHAERLQAEQSVLLRDGFEAASVGGTAVVLYQSRISGSLDCTGATLSSTDGPAVHAGSVRVGGYVLLRDGFEAVGAGELGAVCLLSAQIGAQLDCADARMHNDSGPGMYAADLEVEGSALLRNGFSASGEGDRGAVCLQDASIGGALDCERSTMRNGSGPALQAEGVQVADAVYLRNGFEATGNGWLGTVRLLHARIGGGLDCSRATMRNDLGPALNAARLVVEQYVYLRNGFEAVGAGALGVVLLREARTAGRIQADPTHWRNTDAQHAGVLVLLDGLEYSDLPEEISWQRWLNLIGQSTPSYAAQPYQQLASALRASGHDGEARRVARRQRHDQLRRQALTGRVERGWARFTGLTLGYGYQPWRALIGLLGVVAIAVLLAVGLGGKGGLARTDVADDAAACTTVERIGVGLDMGLPLFEPVGHGDCATTDHAVGQLLTVAGWTLQLLAWGFATLFVAGFTSAVRKT